ncbi:MAG: DUF4412 domain-containing protein [Verrucomicrobia bacterium]|nr:DUF4412 domain-containing protein [Verrucomicrobiota bacterium]
MRLPNHSFVPLAVCVGGLLAGLTLNAQTPLTGGSSAGMNAALTKFFGSNTNFTARSDVRILDDEKKETMSLTMNVAMLDGKMRSDVDMTKLKSAELPPEAIANLKQMGMDHVVSIMRPDKKAMYLIYPGLQAYVNLPLPKAEAEALDKEPKMEKTELGKETIDGHPCTKSKVVVTDDKGEKHEATVWNAADLKDFPVQIQVQEKDTFIMMRYQQLQFIKPDAQQFDPPTGYTQYSDNLKLMQKAMEKSSGNPGGNK